MQKWIGKNNRDQKDSEKKVKNYCSKIDEVTNLLQTLLLQNKTCFPQKVDSPKAQDPDYMVATNNKAPPLEGGHSTIVGGMYNLKHDIRSPKFFELLIKTKLKGDTTLDLNNFYNHIEMSLNLVN